MAGNEQIAAAARLHVALRRATGRVTDAEWMAVNVEYATEMVRLARAHALAQSDAELAAIAARLELAMAPLAAEQRRRAATPAPVEAPAPRYVGGLR
jgi:hypothetical protein